MDSIHEEYLNGETIYAGQLDTLNIRPGFYRAQLEGYTQFLGTSNTIRFLLAPSYVVHSGCSKNICDCDKENIIVWGRSAAQSARKRREKGQQHGARLSGRTAPPALITKNPSYQSSGLRQQLILAIPALRIHRALQLQPHDLF